MTARLLRRPDAAQYVGISPRFFDDRVRPFIPFVRIGACRLYDIRDLDAWVDNQRKIDPAGVQGPGGMICRENQPDSSSAARSGTDRQDDPRRTATPPATDVCVRGLADRPRLTVVETLATWGLRRQRGRCGRCGRSCRRKFRLAGNPTSRINWMPHGSGSTCHSRAANRGSHARADRRAEAGGTDVE